MPRLTLLFLAFIITLSRPSIAKELKVAVVLRPTNKELINEHYEKLKIDGITYRLNAHQIKASDFKFENNTVHFTATKKKLNADQLYEILITGNPQKIQMGISVLHPNNNALISEITRDITKTPEGYKFISYSNNILHDNPTVKGALVKIPVALDQNDVKDAWANRHTNTQVFVELSVNGGKKMKAFTKELTAGKDLIATIIDGQIINTATMAPGTEYLSINFAISGLSNIHECEHLAERLTGSAPKSLSIIEVKTFK